MVLLAVVIGFLLGAAAVWLGARSMARQLADLQSTLRERDSQVTALTVKQAELNAILEQERRSVREKVALLEQAERKLAETFQLLSQQALQANNQAFLAAAREALTTQHTVAKQELSHLLQPVSDALTKVDRQIQEMEKARVGAYEGLREHVTHLAGTQTQLREETARLVNALRAPAQRGRWGEIQLRRVVEMAGMVNYCDFREQEQTCTEDGKLRPDLIVKLPNQKQIIVDAKVSLKAYLEAMEERDEAAKTAKLRDHAGQVRAHLTGLADKNYWNQFSATPEFVVAFLPGEAFFSAALEHDPALIEFGADQRVILATPTTLIALLKAVSYGWRQELIAQNAQAISDLGKQLYDRLLTLHGHWTKLRKGLESAVEGYNAAVGSLEGRVFVTARRFKELGAAAGPELELVETIDRAPRTLSSPEGNGFAAGASV